MLSRVTVALLLMVSMQRGGGGGGGQMGGGPVGDPTQFEQFVDKLNLDEKRQVPEVQRLFTDISSTTPPIEQEMIQARMRMLRVLDNQAELDAATTAYAKAEERMLAV